MKQTETPFLSPDFQRAWSETADIPERPRPSQEQQAAAPGFAAARAAMATARQRLAQPSRLRTFSPLLSTPCPF
jgi:hypothetical protein